jgi:hypothetical protein
LLSSYRDVNRIERKKIVICGILDRLVLDEKYDAVSKNLIF